jgi:hypothetical protein
LRNQGEVSPLHVPAIRKTAKKCIKFAFWRRRSAQETDALHLARLLRADCKRRIYHHTPSEENEIPPPHSITSPVRAVRHVIVDQTWGVCEASQNETVHQPSVFLR